MRGAARMSAAGWAAVVIGGPVLAGVLAVLAHAAMALATEMGRNRIPVLLYHRLIERARVERGEIHDPERVYVAYDTSFADQMRFLKNEGYVTLSLDEYMAWRRGEAGLPPKPILVTFDDGFMSNYLHAFPVLRALAMKATVFVTPDRSSGNFKKYEAFDLPLTPDQMREMSAHGVSIQSHGMTHRYLTGLDATALRWELTESRRALEEIVALPVRYLAVPSGAYSPTVRRMVAACGYDAAFCMLKGTNGRRNDPFSLRRLVVARDHTVDDLRRLLSPLTCAQLRVIGFWQNLVAATIGMRRLDALRRWVYGTRLGRAVPAGHVRPLLGGLIVAAAVLVVLAGAIAILVL